MIAGGVNRADGLPCGGERCRGKLTEVRLPGA